MWPACINNGVVQNECGTSENEPTSTLKTELGVMFVNCCCAFFGCRGGTDSISAYSWVYLVQELLKHDKSRVDARPGWPTRDNIASAARFFGDTAVPWQSLGGRSQEPVVGGGAGCTPNVLVSTKSTNTHPCQETGKLECLAALCRALLHP